jgi:translation initiation factor 3 subunit C
MKTNLVSILEKLEIELYKSLQYTDQNSSEYILRIKDEINFIVLCSKVLEFYKNFNENNYNSRIYLLILLHIYYKTEDQIKKMGEKLRNENVNDKYLLLLAENPEGFLNELSGLLYSQIEDKSKVKSLLAIIYSLCILNKYFKANILFKKCNSYDMIGVLKDENLKILYNRTMAQLALCAFRNGIYSDALLYLTPLCHLGTSKLKEYLSQSYNKEMEKSIFFDKEDKKRIIPFIMTINIEEVECTFYLASMIIDLPNILLYKLGKTYGNVNFVFKKSMDNFEKQVITIF